MDMTNIFSRLGSKINDTYTGWWVVAGAASLAILSGGILNHGAAVFFNPIKRDLSLSSANTSLIFTLSRAQASLGAILYGWMVDKMGAKPLIIVSSIVAGGGLIVVSKIGSFGPFLLSYVVLIAVPANLGFGQTLITATNGWFIRRKATALAIVVTGFAAGGAIFVYPLGLGVDNIGWRPTMFYSGIFVCIMGLILSTLVRNSPSVIPDIEKIDVDNKTDSGISGDSREFIIDFSLSQAFKTKVFWIILVASTLRISAESGINIHIIPIMVWQGAEESFAAGLVSLFYLFAIPFRLGLGVAGQRLQFQPLIITGLISASIGFILLVVTDNVATLYPFIILFAIYEGSVVLQWVAIGNYFGRSSYGSITGFMRFSDTLGTFLAPWFAGWIYDQTGSYSISLVTFAGAMLLSACLFAICRKPLVPVSNN